MLDAPDIAALTAFYTGLAGWQQIHADDTCVGAAPAGGAEIGGGGAG